MKRQLKVHPVVVGKARLEKLHGRDNLLPLHAIVATAVSGLGKRHGTDSLN
jgi:hypothetical protein